MKRKTLSLLLSLCMVGTALAGCGSSSGSTAADTSSDGAAAAESDAADVADAAEEKSVYEKLLEPYEEPVEIHIVLQYRESEDPLTAEDCTPQTSTAVTKLKEDLNIDLVYDWIANADQYEEKFGAELAAGNLPDVFMIGATDFEDLADQGGLADLTELYEEYRCDELDAIFNYDGEFINVATKDGKIYGLPAGTDPAQATSQLLYNMTQLESVGITSADQLPTTIEEFEELCDKLMEVDYDGDGKTGGPVLPASSNYIDAGLADFSPFFHAYETWASGWYDNDGTLEYAGIDENLTTTLTKLNEWYEKGYFAKDFAAYSVWAADSSVVSDIVAGKYAIVTGSWWVPNWPLNSNKVNNPDSEWVVGPNLSLDGEQPAVMLDRYPVSNFVVVGRDCEHPEAVFKMMYWSLKYTVENNNPDVQAAMTEEELQEFHNYVYTWLPYRVYSPLCLRSNYETINALIAEGKTTITNEDAAYNDEFWGAWSSYLNYMENPDDGVAWGTWFSRLAEDGGVANMIKTVETADIVYDEVYVTTASMVTKQSELDSLRDNTFISMIMGETPISEFDAYVQQWKAMGGDEIAAEVNEWYQSK